MNKLYQSILTLILLTLVSNTYAQVKLKKSWQDADINILKSEKVLVLNKFKSEGIRQRGEQEIVKALKARGVEAVEAFIAFPYLSVHATRTEDELQKLIKQFLDAGYEAVVVTRLKNPAQETSTTTRITEGEENDVPFNINHPSTFGPYFNYTPVPNRTPGPSGMEETTDNVSERFELETVIYNIKPGNEKLLGSITIDVTDPKNIMKTLDKYAALVAKQLKK